MNMPLSSSPIDRNRIDVSVKNNITLVIFNMKL